ncbi:hypothetical protein Plhal304r1_c016g0057921 [Plasmopara halstedii]
MTYSPEQNLANKEEIKVAQKRYYQSAHTRHHLSYQKCYDDENRQQIRASQKQTLAKLKVKLIMKTDLIN